MSRAFFRSFTAHSKIVPKIKINIIRFLWLFRSVSILWPIRQSAFGFIDRIIASQTIQAAVVYSFNKWIPMRRMNGSINARRIRSKTRWLGRSDDIWSIKIDELKANRKKFVFCHVETFVVGAFLFLDNGDICIRHELQRNKQRTIMLT